MVVTQQDRGDRRQVLEWNGGLPDSTRSQQSKRTSALGVHGIREEIAHLGLDQECGVPDESDRGGRVLERRNSARRLVNAAGPGPARLAKEFQYRRQRRRSSAARIAKSPAVKVIALVQWRLLAGDDDEVDKIGGSPR